MSNYRGLDWKTGAARRLRPLRRDAAVFSWLFKAHSKFGSPKYTPLPFGRTIDSSSNSDKRSGPTAGAVVTLLVRFPFPGLRGDTVVLLQGWSRAGADPDKYSTCPTSTTLEIRTPARQDGSTNFRWLDTAHPEPSLWCIACLLPPNHHNIIRLPEIHQSSLIAIRKNTRPRLTSGLVSHRTSGIDGRNEQVDPIIAEKIALGKPRWPNKILDASNWLLHKPATQTNSIQLYSECGQFLNRNPKKQGCHLVHLKQIPAISAYNEAYLGTGATTYSEQVLATLKSRLMSEVGQDVPYIKTLPCGMTFQLPLLPDKWLKFGLAGLNVGSLLPTTLHKSIQQLSMQEKGGMVIASKNDFRAETANSLTQFWPGGHGRHDGAAKFVEETAGIAPEFLPQVGARHLF